MKILKFIGIVLLDILKVFGIVMLIAFILRGILLFSKLPGFFNFSFGLLCILTIVGVTFLAYDIGNTLYDYFKRKWENTK